MEEALAVLVEQCDIVRGMFHGYDYSAYFGVAAPARLAALAGGANHVCGLEDGKRRFLDAMNKLEKAAGLAVHLEGARHLRDDVAYFQGVKKNLVKHTIGGSGKSDEELNSAIRQIVSGAVASEGVVDIFATAGLKAPDISILSDEFLETVKASPHRNLQLELLRKLPQDEIRSLSHRNVLQSRKFSEMLDRTLLAYQNRALEAAQVILELIGLAKEMRDAPKRGDALGLTEDEMAFYDALVSHGDVKEVMGDSVLAAIAHDLVDAIRSSVTIDWTQKEAVRADMRRKVKRLLRKYGYPPDKREEALVTVIEQAETVCREWAENPPATPTETPAEILPFRRLDPVEVEPFVNAIPLYDLQVAAGRFSGEQLVDQVPQHGEIEHPENYEWVEIDGRTRPARGLFVAQVTGESMNRRIPNGAYCIWRLHPTGSRQTEAKRRVLESVGFRISPPLRRSSIPPPQSRERRCCDWVGSMQGGGRYDPTMPTRHHSLPHPVRLAATTLGAALLLALPAVCQTTASQSAPDDLATPPEDAERTESGLVTRVLEPGDGDVHPGSEDLVRVHYTGWTSDGEVFDSTADREAPPTLPVELLIPGWQEGLRLMVAGETRRMWIPESLAFAGAEGKPAGRLVFDVELVELIDVPATPDDVASPPAEAEVGKGGLAWVVLRRGDGGEQPKASSRVQVHYTGWTTDGEMFDTSYKLGKPAWFKLTEVIRGWKEGIQLMTRGEVRRFWIPQKMAYRGAQGKPEGMLVFEVELLDFNDR